MENNIKNSEKKPLAKIVIESEDLLYVWEQGEITIERITATI